MDSFTPALCRRSRFCLIGLTEGKWSTSGEVRATWAATSPPRRRPEHLNTCRSFCSSPNVLLRRNGNGRRSGNVTNRFPLSPPNYPIRLSVSLPFICPPPRTTDSFMSPSFPRTPQAVFLFRSHRLIKCSEGNSWLERLLDFLSPPRSIFLHTVYVLYFFFFFLNQQLNTLFLIGHELSFTSDMTWGFSPSR